MQITLLFRERVIINISRKKKENRVGQIIKRNPQRNLIILDIIPGNEK